jgi:hypothetical protein
MEMGPKNGEKKSNENRHRIPLPFSGGFPIHPSKKDGVLLLSHKKFGEFDCSAEWVLFGGRGDRRCVDENVRWTMWTSRGWLSWVRV